MINDPVNYDADYVNEKLRLKEKPEEDRRINVRNVFDSLCLEFENTPWLRRNFYFDIESGYYGRTKIDLHKKA